MIEVLPSGKSCSSLSILLEPNKYFYLDLLRILNAVQSFSPSVNELNLKIVGMLLLFKDFVYIFGPLVECSGMVLQWIHEDIC